MGTAEHERANRRCDGCAHWHWRTHFEISHVFDKLKLFDKLKPEHITVFQYVKILFLGCIVTSLVKKSLLTVVFVRVGAGLVTVRLIITAGGRVALLSLVIHAHDGAEHQVGTTSWRATTGHALK